MKSKLIKNIKRQVKGITLIALVVTIIVLLILAGVAITLTVGDNGLFIRAEIASKEYTIAEIQEELTFAIQDVIMDAIEKGQSATIDDMVNALEKIGAAIGILVAVLYQVLVRAGRICMCPYYINSTF